MKYPNILVLLLMMPLLGNSQMALAKTTKKPIVKQPIVKGNCGKQKCTVLFKELSDRYPEYSKKYVKECGKNQTLGLGTYADDPSQKVYFYCWENKKQKNGDRLGSYLGALPTPGNENKFLTPLPQDTDNSKYLPQIQKKYSSQLKKAQFECATNGGNFNLLTSEDQKSIQLQCYFQAGVIVIDSNNDWRSDGEINKGAGVDQILGTFPK